jgi:hypothetical protein
MRNRVVGAAKFESAHALKILALEEHRRARAFIERARSQNGSTVGDAFKTRCGVDYVVKGGGGKHLHRRNSPEAVAKDSHSPSFTSALVWHGKNTNGVTRRSSRRYAVNRLRLACDQRR